MDLRTLTPHELEWFADDLRVARGHIETGWTQNRLFRMALGDQPTRVCALGAIGVACEGVDGWLRAAHWSDHTGDVIMLLLPHILQDYPDNVMMPTDVETAKQLISLFNDLPNTTQGKVLIWFDRAITEVAGILETQECLV